MEPVDKVWRRATAWPPQDGLRRGDMLFRAALQFHNLVMNGGLNHARDGKSKSDTDEIVEGFLFLGMRDVAELVRRSYGGPEDGSEFGDAEDLFYEISTDQLIHDRLTWKLRESPDEFAPLD